jgi:hypothetical protein
MKVDGTQHRFRCGTPGEKTASFLAIYAWLRSIDERDARAIVREMSDGMGLDQPGLCGELIASWDELRQMAADPRVTIGAQTRKHYALSKLTLAEARAEIEESVRHIERRLGITCRHFSYPYGDEASAGEREFALVRELGLKTAVTARRGLLRHDHAGELTALPRIPLGGSHQRPRHIKLMLNGAPFALRWLPPASARPH